MLTRTKFFVLAMIAGCSSDRSHAVPDAAAEPDATVVIPQGASDYCEAIEPFFCDFYLRCGRMDVATVVACKAAFLTKCNAVYEPRYVGLEAAGLLALDLDGLSACKQHLATVACGVQTQELAGPCATMWRGTQAAGETCGFDVESFVCASGNECVLGLDLCGDCRAVVAIGASCTPGTDTCGAEGFCAEGMCRARVSNGQLCSAADRCVTGSSCDAGTCTGPRYVTRGQACDQRHRCPYLTVCTNGTCQATAAVGEPCTNDGVCELGFCDGGTCAVPRAVHQPCARALACNSGLCDGSTCQARPSACIAD